METHDSDSSLNTTTTSILLPDGSNSSSFPLHDDEDMMLNVRTVSYTSLKDLIQASQTSIMSPVNNYPSCYEIPIKNHLVKQAALAYLQPMSSPPATGGTGFLDKLKENCRFGCCCGCFSWLNDIVFGVFVSSGGNDCCERRLENGGKVD